MAEPSTPTSEAAERLGEAALTNVASVVECATALATALGNAAAPPTSAPGSSSPTATAPTATAPTAADEVARSAMSAWVGGLRAIAVGAAAVTDAAAILSCPPELVERYVIDVADQIPARKASMTLSVQSTAWASANAVGTLPVVSVLTAQPVPAPSPSGADVVLFRVRPSVAPLALLVTVRVDLAGAPAAPPTDLVFRLSPENLVLEP